ncbi:MAG: ParB N-terminal domain-containing protein [Lachnospiraceae bacterium]|nr:ParB N-terminal domain-containing protein [Lachnospiraceae bacterium]
MKSNEDKVVVLKLDQIDPNPRNAQIFTLDGIESLAKNISDNGLIEYPIVSIKSDGRYELIAGERRCAALRSLGETEVKCIVRSVPGSEVALQQLIDSNVFARSLTPLEYAKVIEEYKVLIKAKRSNAKNNEFKGSSTRKQVADALGISESKVKRYSALLSLIPELQELTNDPSFPYSALYPVAQLPEDKQKEFYNKLNIIKDDFILTHEDDDTSFAISRNTVDRIIKSMNYVSPRSRVSGSNPEILASSIDALEHVDVSDEKEAGHSAELGSGKNNEGNSSEIIEKPLDMIREDLTDSVNQTSKRPFSDSSASNVDNETDHDNNDKIDQMIENMLYSIRGINGVISVNRRGRTQIVKDEVREYLNQLRKYIDEIEETL